MELREISTFLQVAQLKSFSKAAHQLGYSQAAVTVQIHNLERELQVHLFDRIGKQITLTHQGMVFYTYACGILRDLARAKDAVADASVPTGRLCLGTIESICASLLPSLIREYHRLYPKVSVSILTDSPEALLEMMNQNAVDIVYFLDKRIYDPKWVKVLEQPEEIVFVASQENPIIGCRELSLEQVIAQPFILTERDASYRLMLDQYLTAQQKQILPFLETGNTEFILQMLRSNLGISFLPEFTVRQDVQQGTLSVLKVKDFSMRSWRQVVYHKDKWVSREMEAFLNLVGLQETKA